MSFRSREKKRKAKAARTKARPHPACYYLTIVSRTCSCNKCGGRLSEGSECVYRHAPKWILHVSCARGLGLKLRPSRKWERRRQATSAPAREQTT